MLARVLLLAIASDPCADGDNSATSAIATGDRTDSCACDASPAAAAYSFLHVEHSSARAGRSRSAHRANASSADDATVEPPRRAKRLVVSMSSFPGRVEYINPTVFSIMYGLRKPDALYLWVPVNVSRFEAGDREVNGLKELPDNVKGLVGHFGGVVKAKIPPMDYGPATKLLPTLLEEKDPDTVIITIDVSAPIQKFIGLICTMIVRFSGLFHHTQK
jgi:hypothetical protein